LKFILLDRVTECVPGKRIRAVKALTLAEEYLGDHFPTFPVLPGVMMIEAMVQTAAMLVRLTNDFAQSMVVLSEARNVKYKSFIKPGNIMNIAIDARSIGAGESDFSGTVHIGDQLMVEARLKLRHYNLADAEPALAETDARIIQAMKHRAQLVGAVA
jgi:3-hydroxyacyl-[acyl-carrier-protein] dehydratase